MKEKTVAGAIVMGYIQGANRDQIILFPESLDDYVNADNEVRAIDAFIDALDLGR